MCIRDSLKALKETTIESQSPVIPAAMPVVSCCETKHVLNGRIDIKDLVNKNRTSRIQKYLEIDGCIMCGSNGFAAININTGRRIADHRLSLIHI